MKITLPLIAGTIAVTFTSCTKEPTACFKASNENPKLFEVITFTNCSEDAESYDWIMQTDFIEGTSRAENPTFTRDVDGTFNVELEVTSKNDKKSDVTSESITVIDVC
jgi:PKD repeat protein